MTTEITIDQEVLQSEIDLKRQHKTEIEKEIEDIREEASQLKKRQDVLTIAKEGLKSGIDITIIDNEIKTINDKVWKLWGEVETKLKAVQHYERFILRLEEMQE